MIITYSDTEKCSKCWHPHWCLLNMRLNVTVEILAPCCCFTIDWLDFNQYRIAFFHAVVLEGGIVVHCKCGRTWKSVKLLIVPLKCFFTIIVVIFVIIVVVVVIVFFVIIIIVLTYTFIVSFKPSSFFSIFSFPFSLSPLLLHVRRPSLFTLFILFSFLLHLLLFLLPPPPPPDYLRRWTPSGIEALHAIFLVTSYRKEKKCYLDPI